MRWYVYRSGYHEENNPLNSGGPETMLVAEVHARTADEACQLAKDGGVTVYKPQFLYANDANLIDRVKARLN